MTTTTTTTTDLPLDEQAVGAFAGRIMSLFTGGMLTYLVDIGHRTGLFDAVAAGPGSSVAIADRAGLHERYVREWLGAMATAGIVEYDADTSSYRLPPEHAACLAGTGPMNMAAFSQLNTHLAKHVGAVADAFRHGGGVPYAEYRPEFTDVMDAMGRAGYDGLLVNTYVPMAPGLVDRLRAGARVADVACGTGHALVLLAQAFPSSTFAGYDLDEAALGRGRAEATAAGLSNVTFAVCDVATLAAEQAFDAVFMFDALHDQADPQGVLEHIHAALAPGGTFFLKEPRVSSNLEDNIGNPFAPLVYSVSTLHCMPVSLALGGAGLGTAFGEQLARRLLTDAGFRDISVLDAPGDPIDAVFISSRASA